MQLTIKTIFEQPLIHFLLIGLGFFLLYEIVSGGETGTCTIIVDKDALLTHLQYRSKAFNVSVFEEKLGAMSQEELQQMIDEYVREEVLYREAMAMGLDKEDYIIKRRMIQKVEFISEGIAEATADLSDEELKRYYEENMENYYVQPYATFTHVFFDFEKWSREEAEAKAKKELVFLNQNSVPFNQATSRGDWFFYHTNYVEREPEYIASHFGAPMAQAIFVATPSDKKWIGPFVSQYGCHLVMLTKNEPGRYPDLEEVKARVTNDAQRDCTRKKNEETIREIIDGYEIKVTYSVGS